MRKALTTFLAGLVFAGGVATAQAEPITVKQAKKLLFKGSKFTVQYIEGAALDTFTRVQVESLVEALQDPKVARQWQGLGFSIDYYGAIAVKPDRPISDKTMGFSNNLHSPEAAQATAIAACNALPGPDCVAVAVVLPNRYKPQPFSLSQAATTGFRDNWGKPRDPQYLAYSPTTGAWVIAKGAGAESVAIERCNEQAATAGAQDCLIGIAED